MASVNLCDITSFINNEYSMIDFGNEFANVYKQKIQRLYVGSYFCERYFITSLSSTFKEIERWCKDNNVHITLVFPPASETLFDEMIKCGEKLCKSEIIDEITVNDYGTLLSIKDFGKRINIGRLFDKDSRDKRHPNIFEKCKTISHIDESKFAGFDINLYEYDNTNASSKIEIPNIAIHTPLMYVSMSKICRFAGIGQPENKKFRPNSPCNEECSHIMLFPTSLEDGKGEQIYCIGKGIYFKNESVNTSAERLIIFPAEMIPLGGAW